MSKPPESAPGRNGDLRAVRHAARLVEQELPERRQQRAGRGAAGALVEQRREQGGDAGMAVRAHVDQPLGVDAVAGPQHLGAAQQVGRLHGQRIAAGVDGRGAALDAVAARVHGQHRPPAPQHRLQPRRVRTGGPLVQVHEGRRLARRLGLPDRGHPEIRRDPHRRLGVEPHALCGRSGGTVALRGTVAGSTVGRDTHRVAAVAARGIDLQDAAHRVPNRRDVAPRPDRRRQRVLAAPLERADLPLDDGLAQAPHRLRIGEVGVHQALTR